MDPLKPKTMSTWHIPTKKNKVQVFLGFANYHRRFIVNYNTKAHHLINLTKDVAFTCRHTKQQAFYELQGRFLAAPILTQFNRKFQTIMEPDATNQAIAGIPSQYNVVNRCKQLHQVE